jgi:hypothetical protein
MFTYVGVQVALFKFGTPLYNGCCNLELHLLPTHVVINFMDPITGRVLFQKEVDHINKNVWEIVK